MKSLIRWLVNAKISCRLINIALFLSFLPIVTGCPKVNPKPFQEFSTSVQEIRKGADKLLSEDYGMARERMLRNASNEPLVVINQLKIERVMDEDGKLKDYEWRMADEPLFMTIRRYRTGVNEFNSVLTTYAEALANLAGPISLTEDQVTDMATKLTTNTADAAGSLDIQVDNDNLALFSTVAVGAFQQYLSSKQRKDLNAALEHNQRWMAEVSRLGQQASKNAAVAMWQEFLISQGEINSRIARAKDSATRRSLAERKIELNERFGDMLEALRTLDEAYAKLPSAHGELANSLKIEYTSVGTIRELYELGQRLDRLHRQMKQVKSVTSDKP